VRGAASKQREGGGGEGRVAAMLLAPFFSLLLPSSSPPDVKLKSPGLSAASSSATCLPPDACISTPLAFPSVLGVSRFPCFLNFLFPDTCLELPALHNWPSPSFSL